MKKSTIAINNATIFSGFAVGSLIGGLLYKKVGGAITLRIFSILAALSALMYLILHVSYLKYKTPGKKLSNFEMCVYVAKFLEEWKNYARMENLLFVADTRNNVEWRKPEDAQKQCVVAET